MQLTAISQAKEVVNIHDGSQSWSVEEVFLDKNSDVVVILVNNNLRAFHQKQCVSEKDLTEQGYRGFV